MAAVRCNSTCAFGGSGAGGRVLAGCNQAPHRRRSSTIPPFRRGCSNPWLCKNSHKRVCVGMPPLPGSHLQALLRAKGRGPTRQGRRRRGRRRAGVPGAWRSRRALCCGGGRAEPRPHARLWRGRRPVPRSRRGDKRLLVSGFRVQSPDLRSPSSAGTAIVEAGSSRCPLQVRTRDAWRLWRRQRGKRASGRPPGRRALAGRRSIDVVVPGDRVPGFPVAAPHRRGVPQRVHLPSQRIDGQLHELRPLLCQLRAASLPRRLALGLSQQALGRQALRRPQRRVLLPRLQRLFLGLQLLPGRGEVLQHPRPVVLQPVQQGVRLQQVSLHLLAPRIGRVGAGPAVAQHLLQVPWGSWMHGDRGAGEGPAAGAGPRAGAAGRAGKPARLIPRCTAPRRAPGAGRCRASELGNPCRGTYHALGGGCAAA